MFIFSLSAILISIIFYYRYFPIMGIKQIHPKDIDVSNTKIVDVRDYIDSYKEPVKGAVNIPIAYLKRNYHEITNENIYVIASNMIERNMAIRFLRKKRFRVIGYSIFEQKKNKLFTLQESNIPCKHMD